MAEVIQAPDKQIAAGASGLINHLKGCASLGTCPTNSVIDERIRSEGNTYSLADLAQIRDLLLDCALRLPDKGDDVKMGLLGSKVSRNKLRHDSTLHVAPTVHGVINASKAFQRDVPDLRKVDITRR